MKRREFPAKVMVLAFSRAKGLCEKCGARLYVGKIHYDHRVPDAMGGEPTLDNCDVLCSSCHGEKTATVDVPAIAKVKRIERKHIGAARPKGFWKPANAEYDWKLGRYVRLTSDTK